VTTLYDMDRGPVEIGPGRGDLRYSSIPANGSLAETMGRRVSYALLFAEQPMIGAAVMWQLAESVRVPLKVYRRTGDDSRERLRSGQHPLATAIATPWPRASAAQLGMALLGPLLVHGNSLCGIDNGAGNTIQFQPADYRFAQPIQAVRDSIAGWTLDQDNPATERTVGSDTVLHVAWWSPFGPLGVSPLRQLGTTINIERAAQMHQESLLRNQAKPPSAITIDKDFLQLNPASLTDLMDQLRGDISSLYSGANAGRPALLPPGLDWKMVGHSAVEAQLIQQRMVAREEVGAVYRIAPGCFGLGLDKAGTPLADQRQMSYVDGLAPPLILVEQMLNAQVVNGLLRESDVYTEFDFSGLLRGDKLQEIEALREAIASALTTPNEGRAVLNLPKSAEPGMDEFYLPRNNLWPLSQPYPAQGMGASTDPAPDPVPAQDPPSDADPDSNID
jgi:HK97 family phage portal protein